MAKKQVDVCEMAAGECPGLCLDVYYNSETGEWIDNGDCAKGWAIGKYEARPAIDEDGYNMCSDDDPNGEWYGNTLYTCSVSCLCSGCHNWETGELVEDYWTGAAPGEWGGPTVSRCSIE